ncbi:unnamed protein product [Vicia faba]|uniref:Patellin-6 n=1 Tax=Vicia faba TaxID=3906 RepID=A0AAV1AV34_VICFA|nr:unnamed protein product [Vicia faba]
MAKNHLSLSQFPHSSSMDHSSSSTSSITSTTPFLETPKQPCPKPHKKTIVTTLMEAANFTSSSFKEDTYFVSSLKSSEKKALQELKKKLSASKELNNNASMWGVSLLNANEAASADVVLLKFLRARDFRVSDAYTMLMRCLTWRKEFGAENIIDEELGFKDLEDVVTYTHGYDRKGHPVCYNHYVVFKDKDLYERIFGDGEKLKRFLRWRLQVLKRGIKLLHLNPGGVNSLIQVIDLKDMPRKELRTVSNEILTLFQDNYPEMVAHKIFINVPWYFSMLYAIYCPFLTQRTKSKFVISKEGNATETLYKFIRPENIPVQYGGLSRPSDFQNGPPKPASEFTVKGGEKVNIQIQGIESGATIKWEIVVGGWEVQYSAEFVPNAESSYTIAVDKSRKVGASEEVIEGSFTSKEGGIIVLTVDNSGSRKKKFGAYRYVVPKCNNSNTTSDNMQLIVYE